MRTGSPPPPAPSPRTPAPRSLPLLLECGEGLHSPVLRREGRGENHQSLDGTKSRPCEWSILYSFLYCMQSTLHSLHSALARNLSFLGSEVPLAKTPTPSRFSQAKPKATILFTRAGKPHRNQGEGSLPRKRAQRSGLDSCGRQCPLIRGRAPLETTGLAPE